MTQRLESQPSGSAAPRLFDTMSREVRALAPSDGQRFRFYCCGPTVYGPAHIGNFRSFVVQDLFRRMLETSGIPTRFVRNITDVDDKTIRQSQAEGLSLSEFTARWSRAFHADCQSLHILPPDVEPSAVAHIPEQIELIATLVEKGAAYQGGDGSVYFRIQAFPAYGRLSRLDEREITTGRETNGAEIADEYDRDHAADFALWKAHRKEDGPNSWDSPWGPGRPGWHIECSTMAMKHLGNTLDLHGGGVDLIFPHHENEIAQSEAATGETFALHWFHVAHLLVEGKKMSKSLGNLFTLDDVLAKGFSAEELRYVLLSGHYRQPLNFTWDSLSAAKSALAKLRQFAGRIGVTPSPLQSPPPPVPDDPFQPVLDAMADDLGSPEALGRLFRITRELQDQMASSSPAPQTLATWRDGFQRILFLFGFHLEESAETEAPQEIQDLAALRWEAKKQKNWAEADRLRNEVHEAGWSIEDAADHFKLVPLPK